MSSKEMQISEEEYYATLLSNPDYSETKFSIYRFKNLINGKIYIGQTTVPVRKRLIQHMTFSRPWTKCHKTYFHNAIYKYGLNNFDFSVIEICKSQEELDIREKYWINYYKSNDKQFGYNIESGGKDGRKGIKLTEVHKQKLLEANLGKPRKENTREAIKNTHKELWKNDKYRKEHLDVVKCSLSSYWQKSSKKVYQYDKHGNFIAVWNKCKDVIDFLYGIGANGNLSRNIKLNNKRGKLGFSKNGYIWSFFAPQGKEEL
ncbi:MAG: GIY-YIG nuclease family protein [Catenibacterium sp.]|jgi:group I intron endonuclease|uniref:GIY-YIG nuclease family protein n=1 Tax=Catenibacterium sp. TaxID=2049022 RepID=UPI002209E203|nr:MAG: GIY-YIG catalytic domain protein [Bacteriophage sp.]